MVADEGFVAVLVCSFSVCGHSGEKFVGQPDRHVTSAGSPAGATRQGQSQARKLRRSPLITLDARLEIATECVPGSSINGSTCFFRFAHSNLTSSILQRLDWVSSSDPGTKLNAEALFAQTLSPSPLRYPQNLLFRCCLN